jgi:hypothetical protein
MSDARPAAMQEVLSSTWAGLDRIPLVNRDATTIPEPQPFIARVPRRRAEAAPVLPRARAARVDRDRPHPVREVPVGGEAVGSASMPAPG